MKHWVFDLDGTLVDSLTTHFHILKKIFNHFGSDFTKENHQEVLKITAKTLPEYLASKLGNDSVKPAHDMFQSLNSESYQDIKAFAGIEELLQSLSAGGAKLAVWTARDLEATKQILAHSGLSSYFSVCVSSTCTNEGKPHPEGLQKIADHFACERDSMVMVGDFDSDMLGAKAFGIKAIRVAWHDAVPAKRCEIAQWQFHKVSDLNEWTVQEFTSNRI